MSTKTFTSGVYANDLINSEDYSKTVALLREFFVKKGFIEVPTQSRLSILAACEDPTTVSTYTFEGEVWPLPQTGQMWLEYELLTKPNVPGYFCLSTSYRAEPNPIPDRHRTIFPMFEFETHGGLEQLAQLEKELVTHLGLVDSPDAVPHIDYAEIAEKYGTTDIDNHEEAKIYQEYGNVALLCDFPNYTSPFWNMRSHEGQNKARKIDAIICGQETIGSAERAVNADEMRHAFHTISDGEYANLLFNKFGKARVLQELEDYLSLDFFERCGGGIGVTRMMHALKTCNII
ncbi:asparagine synthetase A [Phocoenobacter uteri]|uniref:Asparagine synthetase A n=1 Tax=Phocoenobacter uteri TaxID=146806 RepID=A0A379CBU1_9PAST|nr:amino acid--tRNA ligase-related protein [Phocoenobacter uteri]MDG6881567.1 transposase [Phocoenobacter uteri]SUB59598.1 asparagine synthetase A [Phocoenobacter uteri]